jgi:periplasmic protein TonB
MPLNVGRFCTSVFLVTTAVTGAAFAQAPPQQAPLNAAAPQPIAAAPSAADVMRARIDKAKAFIAVRNYNAAIYELEQIKRESGEQSVQAVTNVLLMNSYLEQGDHKKAQALLNQFYNEQKTTKPNALVSYATVAGQIVKSARNQVERYRSLGLNVMDRNLPLEALADLDKMRETVELVVTQSKELSADKVKASTVMGLLEEATTSRALIARDEYDARRWRDNLADSREAMASSRSVVINAVDGTTEAAPAALQQTAALTVPQNTTAPVPMQTVSATVQKPAVNNPAPNNTPVQTQTAPVQNQLKHSESTIASVIPKTDPVVERPRKSDEKPILQQPQPQRTPIIVGQSQQQEDANKVKATSSSRPTNAPSGPVSIGSLLPYAEKQAAPVYPAAARSMRASGVVKVEVTLDEQGNVAEVNTASGPILLQGSAKDAIRKWKFRPVMVEGQAVKATGFVSFNFSL